ncbi:MAG TPA: two-component regulator propeller domain-containing protein [Cyclobacteriaceae bacterium]|nr:two-component regulator propeller domain-containing protein [Cyclobacteriaceae bacterium]
MIGRVFIVFLVLGPFLLHAEPGDEYRFLRLNVNQGLSHNQVNCFLRDRQGFLWAGTASGLNRFDGYSVKVFLNRANDSTSLVDNYIIKLFEDPDGRIWVTTYFGVCVYNPETGNFDRNPDHLLEAYGLPSGRVLDIVDDGNGAWWFIHEQAGLYRYVPDSGKAVPVLHHDGDVPSAVAIDKTSGAVWAIFRSGTIVALDQRNYDVRYTNTDLLRPTTSEYLDFNLRIDNDGDLWIFVANANLGVYYMDSGTRELRQITRRSAGNLRLNSDIVRNLAVGNNGLIWIGSDHGGINLIDKKTWSVRYLMNDPGDDRSLSQNSINTIYIDYENILWVGTFKQGVSYYHENLTKFRLIRHRDTDDHSLPYDDVNAMVEDSRGNIWIGTNGGGLIRYNPATDSYTRYVHDPADPNSLSNDVIVSLIVDHRDELWIGTYFGGIDRFDGKRFTHYRYDATDRESISDDNGWSLLEDANHDIWVGTLVGGLNRFDRKTGKFQRYTASDGIRTGYVPALLEDDENTIWVGTGYGISFRRHGESTFTHILASDAPGSLSNNSITDLYQDSRGLIWIGTQDGLNVYDRKEGRFKYFRVEDGLPHNAIVGILEDDTGTIWASTPNGISRVAVSMPHGFESLAVQFKNYDELDGLQGKQFNHRSALRTHSGVLLFGGSNGINMFHPDRIVRNTARPPVVLLDLQIFNRSVGVGETLNGRVILEKPVTRTESLTLRHDQNVFSLEFAALSFFHPTKNQYKYKLEGFNKEWLTTDGASRKVTYTNLDPGDYVFRVIAANNDGVWNEEGVSLAITVLPPFWKTRIALGLYLLVILGALLLTRRLILQRERIKVKVQQEREEARRVHELDMLKIKFFTNISHEFRTPLTLILAPIERLMKHSRDPAEKGQLQMVYRNARRLLNLVNQLMDFRKMEVQEIRLTPERGDLVRFCRDVAFSFSDLSEKKNIKFSFETKIQQLDTLFDRNKVERILFNLISNAFKFTREGGQVSVKMDLDEEAQSPAVRIQVADTGIGIAREDQERIFERFFQSETPGNMVNQGSGIGLSIAREFVRLHGGVISVESEIEKGSVFTVVLPVRNVHIIDGPESLAEPETPALTQATVSDEPLRSRKKPVLLLVEDNEDFRFYLKDNLNITYHVVEASNGVEGWRQACANIPDLIVSDVMMPEMDGMAFLRKVRGDKRTSHIPLILLTARAAEEQIREGFDMGADDYVTKPFSFEILQSRIRNLLERRQAMRQTLGNRIEVKASEIQISSLDEKLIEKAVKFVEEHISDPDFTVETLSHELGMSRVHLYKKLVALTGKSPLEFIRTIRLQRAAQLLEKSQLTVAEVAYKVGFNNPKYFARYFKEHFNVLPSLYAGRKQ